MLQLSPSTTTRRALRGAGVTTIISRSNGFRMPLKHAGRKPCKPVCFKDNTPDSIDGSTTGPRSTTNGNPTGVWTTPTATGPHALRPVPLGAVATMLYPALSTGTLLAALAATLAPGVTGSTLFRGASLTFTQKLLVFMAGASLVPTFAAKRQIKQAADKGTLASPAYKQMVTACLLQSVLTLVVLSQAVSLQNPVLGGTVGALAGLSTLTNAYTLMKIRESGQLMPSARGMLGGVLSLLTPANLTATAYSLLTIASIAIGCLMFTSDPTSSSPVFTTPKDAIHVFASRMTGAATLANAVLLFIIKEAADDGRQGSPACRELVASTAVYSCLTTGALLYAVWRGAAQSAPATWAFTGVMGATTLLTLGTWINSRSALPTIVTPITRGPMTATMPPPPPGVGAAGTMSRPQPPPSVATHTGTTMPSVPSTAPPPTTATAPSVSPTAPQTPRP